MTAVPGRVLWPLWPLVGLVFFAVLALGRGAGDGLAPAVTLAFCAVALFLPLVALGLPRVREALPRPGHFSPLVALFLIPLYLVYWAGTGGGTGRGLVILSAYLLLSALLVVPVRSGGSIWVAAAALALWLPFDLDWPEARPMAGLWGWPRGELGYALSSLVASVAALVYFGWARPIGIRFDWRLDRRSALLLAGLLLVLAAVLVPLGQATGFLALGLSETFSQPQLEALGELWAMAVVIFVFVAIPEELLFRGILQNWIEQRWAGVLGPWLSLALAALIFGAAHLNNQAGAYPPPNFAYMGMASLAGLGYGYAWRRGGILAAALLHAAVDWVWRFFLAGRPG